MAGFTLISGNRMEWLARELAAHIKIRTGDSLTPELIVIQSRGMERWLALEIARQAGARSILNTAPFLPDTEKLAPLADIVVANETEFSLLTGRPIAELDMAMQDWVNRTGRTIVVTLGPEGARARTPDGPISVAAHKIKPVDTVGAGDTFCGYLAAGLDAGYSLEAALRRAAVAGSLACLKPGAQPAIPTKSDVDGVLGV